MNKYSVVAGVIGLAGGIIIGGVVTFMMRPAAHPVPLLASHRLPSSGNRLILGTDNGELWMVPFEGDASRWQPTLEIPSTFPLMTAPSQMFAFRDRFYTVTRNGEYAAWTFPPVVWSSPWNRYPVFSSNGQYIALTTRANSELHIMEVQTQETRPLTTRASIVGVRWSPDDDFLIIETMEGTDLTAATFHYYRVTADGTNLTRLFTIQKGSSVFSSLRFAPDGRSLLYVQSTGNPAMPRDLYRLDLERGRRTRLYHHADPATYIRDAEISPDGTHIAIGTAGVEPYSVPGVLWLLHADEGDLRPLYELPPFGEKQDFFGRYQGYQGVTALMWSPDSQQIAFTVSQQGDCSGSSWNEGGVLSVTCRQRLLTIHRNGQNLQPITADTPFTEGRTLYPLLWVQGA